MDFTVQEEGNIVILYPETQDARDWVVQHLPPKLATWGRVGIVVEHRCIPDIIDGIESTGMKVQR